MSHPGDLIVEHGPSAAGSDMVKPAAERTGADVPQDRAAIRRRISKLAERKLAAKDRMKVRQWANSVFRTDGELADKLAKLTQMGDLT